MIVLLESPYFALNNPRKTYENIQYARKAMAHSLSLGETPIVTHLMYTQVLDDYDKEQRQKGLKTGATFHDVIEKVVVYFDKGLSPGMLLNIGKAQDREIRVEYRSLRNLDFKVVENQLFCNQNY